MHGVLGHDGLDPADLRARGRTELGRYGVEVETAEVQSAEAVDGTVRVTSSHGADLTRTVLLATGMLDEVPDIPGFAEVWGTSAHTCPYCEGFEHRDERLAILAADARGEPAECLASETTFEILRGQMCGCRVDNALAQQRRARFAALTLGRLVRVDP